MAASVDYKALINEFGSPLYVYDIGIVRRQAQKLKQAFAGLRVNISYALKANYCLAIVKELQAQGVVGFGIDAVSSGEVLFALKSGFRPDQIMYTENNMTDAEMNDAIRSGVLINVGSLNRLRAVARAGVKRVCIRINPDVGMAECAHTLTAGPLAKFGIHFSYVNEVLEIEHETGVKIIGCHMHIGSNILDSSAYVDAMKVILTFAKRLPNLEFINCGGGLGVPYQESQEGIGVDELGSLARDMMRQFCGDYGRPVELHLEPGRYLTAECGTLLATVCGVKRNPSRQFAGLDTGFNHLIRPVLYNAYHPLRNITAARDVPKELFDVVGNICESGDCFGRDRLLQTPKIGDVMSIGIVGAYGDTMASTYNLRAKPAIVVVDADSGTARLYRKRQNLEELVLAELDHETA